MSSESSAEAATNDRPGLVLAGFFVFLALGAAFAHRIAGQTADDFFITYHYAQNLVAGSGFVFNPGQWVLGTTAPGWGLCLALLHQLCGVAIPLLGSWTTGLFLALGCGLLLQEGVRIGRGLEAFLGGLFVMTAVYFWSHNGFELYAVFFVLLLAARALQSRPAVAGALAGLAVWGRPDAALVAAALGGWLALDRRWREMWRYGLVLAAVVGSGLLLAFVFYGSPLPGTLEAKRLQAAWMPGIWPSGRDFWLEGMRWARDAFAGSRLPWLLVLGFPGLFLLLRRRSPGLLLLGLQGLITLVSYPLLGVPFYTWYSIPVLMALLYGTAFAVGEVTRRLLAGAVGWGSWHRWAVLALGLVVLPLPVELAERSIGSYRGFQGMPRFELYREAGLWLHRNTPADSTVGFVEVGTIAYYSRREVHDLLGLVTPEALPYVARGDLAAYLREHPTDYFLTTGHLAGMLRSITEAPWFVAQYEVAAEIRAHGATLTIYGRVPDAGAGTEEKGEHAFVPFL